MQNTSTAVGKKKGNGEENLYQYRGVKKKGEGGTFHIS